MTGPTRILLTGASAGLGRALALRLAGPGVTLYLCGRREDALAEVASACRAQGAAVEIARLDLTDRAAVDHWIAGMEETPDTAILNAGIFDGRGGDGRLESPARAARVIETNLTAPAALSLQLAERMRAARRGTLLFVSSLGAFQPAADAPSYSASKSGLTAFARALREDLAPDGVRVVVVHPGHIRTAQTEVHRGPLPGLMPVDTAARHIVAALDGRAGEVSFPRHLRIALWAQALLPWRWQARINRGLRFWVDHDPD